MRGGLDTSGLRRGSLVFRTESRGGEAPLELQVGGGVLEGPCWITKRTLRSAVKPEHLSGGMDGGEECLESPGWTEKQHLVCGDPEGRKGEAEQTAALGTVRVFG